MTGDGPQQQLSLAGLPPLTDGQRAQLSWADLSDDGVYRYMLGRRWDDGPTALWVMLNPSTADAYSDDQTIRRCRYFSTRAGCGALLVVNLAAYRATDPQGLLTAAVDPSGGTRNRAAVEAAAADPDVVIAVVAWGGWPTSSPAARTCRLTNAAWLVAQRHPLHCLGVTADGSPRHPARLPNDTKLTLWPHCTGLAASWCPRCGDCDCTDPDALTSPDCPLHAPAAAHPHAHLEVALPC